MLTDKEREVIDAQIKFLEEIKKEFSILEDYKQRIRDLENEARCIRHTVEKIARTLEMFKPKKQSIFDKIW